jgi:hypothetical protein
MIKEFDIIDYFTSIEVLLRSTHPIDLAASTQRLGAKFSNNKITPHRQPFFPLKLPIFVKTRQNIVKT